MQADTCQTLPEIFLFVNALSGDCFGRKLLDLDTRMLSFSVPRSQRLEDQDNLVPIKVYIFNMIEEEQRNAGLEQLAALSKGGLPAIMVVCGGDGSIMWMVTQMANFHIDQAKVPLGIIPLGTGNSLSRVMGWGPKCADLISDDYARLKKRISFWLNARCQSLDIWMVEAEVQQYGKFERVNNHQSTVLEGKYLTKHFCSYFSIGIDGKIGYSFELHRTGCRVANMAVYGAMGFIKSFTKTKTLGQLIQEFRLCKVEQIQEQQSDPKGEKGRKLKNEQEVIFQRGREIMQLFNDNKNLLAININSYMGGVQDVWTNAKVPQHLKNQNFLPLSHKDGIIEMVSFGGAWSLGLQKVIGGFGTKVHQGSGPYQIIFNQYPQGQKHRSYFQADGQHYRFTHPKRLVLKKSTLTKTSQIKILRRVPVDIQKNCCSCL